jgi:hypothetical protein
VKFDELPKAEQKRFLREYFIKTLLAFLLIAFIPISIVILLLIFKHPIFAAYCSIIVIVCFWAAFGKYKQDRDDFFSEAEFTKIEK